MPLGEPLSGFFLDEYTRAMKGFDGLQGIEKPRTKAALRRDRENAARPRVVQIPGWDDVLHVRPRLPVTKDQAYEYYRATRRGFAPNLSPEVLHEMRRRAARQDAMARSPQPNFDRAWGSVMTAIDNVQDLLASVSVLGRVALTIGPRVGLRVIPGLGALVTAAEVLTYAMLLGQLAFPLWVGLCAGLKPGLHAFLGTAVTAGVFKGATGLLARSTGRSLAWQFKTPVRIATHTGAAFRTLQVLRAPGFADPRFIAGLVGVALVVGQTTDSLFGYGISLGPIVGATMGAAYSAEAIHRGEAVEFRSSPSAEHFGPRIRERLAELPTSALHDRILAADVWAHAALVLADDSPATDQDRLECMAATLAAIGILWQDWKGSGWQDDAYRLVGWQPEIVSSNPDGTGWWQLDRSATVPPASEWPESWGGRQYDPAKGAIVVPGAIARGLERAASRLQGFAEPAFIGAATVDGAETLWRLLTDDEDAVRPTMTPGWLAAERMTALGILPAPPEQTEKFQPFWNAVLARVDQSKNAMKTLAEWEQLATAHEVQLVILSPPTIRTVS